MKRIKISLRVTFLLGLCLGLNACFFQTDEEKIASFNRTYGPEYKLSQDDLYVHWKGDKQALIEPLNLKIPVAYLEYNSERIKRGDKFYWLGLSLEPMENGEIERVKIELLRSNSQPVSNTNYKKADLEEEIKKKNHDIGNSYRFTIYAHSNEDWGTSKYYLLDRGYFRGRDEVGLENYREMKCFTEKDIEVLKQETQQRIVGNEFKQKDLDALQNKQKNDDQSPKNCITQETGRGTYWLSPTNVPIKEKVEIDCWFACQITFTYKSHLIVVIATGGAKKVIPQWRSYHQQVIDLLNRFEQEANQSQIKSQKQ